MVLRLSPGLVPLGRQVIPRLQLEAATKTFCVPLKSPTHLQVVRILPWFKGVVNCFDYTLLMQRSRAVAHA